MLIRIVDEQGDPIEDVYCRVNTVHYKGHRKMESDAKGKVQLESLPDTKIEMFLYKNGYQSKLWTGEVKKKLKIVLEKN